MTVPTHDANMQVRPEASIAAPINPARLSEPAFTAAQRRLIILSRLGSQALALGYLLVLSAKLAPSDFGVAAVSMSIAAFIFIALDLGHSQSGQQYLSHASARTQPAPSPGAFLTSSITIKLTSFSALMLALVLVSVDIQGDSRYFVCIAIGMMANVGAVICAPWIALGLRKPWMFLFSSVAPRACQIGVLLAMKGADYSLEWLLFQTAAVHLLCSLLGSLLMFHHTGLIALRHLSISSSKQIFSLGWKSSMTSLSSAGFSPCLLLLVALKQSPELAGAFAIVDRIVRSMVDVVFLLYQASIMTTAAARRLNLVLVCVATTLFLLMWGTPFFDMLATTTTLPIRQQLAIFPWHFLILPVTAHSIAILFANYILPLQYHRTWPTYLVSSISGLCLYALIPAALLPAAAWASVFAETLTLILLKVGAARRTP
jgi:hypothetical protein